MKSFFYGTFIVLDPKHIISEYDALATFKSAVQFLEVFNRSKWGVFRSPKGATMYQSTVSTINETIKSYEKLFIKHLLYYIQSISRPTAMPW